LPGNSHRQWDLLALTLTVYSSFTKILSVDISPHIMVSDPTSSASAFCFVDKLRGRRLASSLLPPTFSLWYSCLGSTITTCRLPAIKVSRSRSLILYVALLSRDRQALVRLNTVQRCTMPMTHDLHVYSADNTGKVRKIPMPFLYTKYARLCCSSSSCLLFTSLFHLVNPRQRR
jgi:hypothetical protein